MDSKTIYVLHKQGAPSHYIGLKYLLDEHDIKIEMREFSIFTLFFRGFKTFDLRLIRKQYKNFRFLLNLFLSKNQKVVVGIAPFDAKIKFIMRILKAHRVYYHTSWSTWDKTFHPKTKGNNDEVFEAWRFFLEEQCEQIFCVTRRTRNQLLENYNIAPSKASVVYHALFQELARPRAVAKQPKSFIYYGRMIRQKGIAEILEFFSINSELSLTLIGDGKEQDLILEYQEKYKNIEYKRGISNKSSLAEELAKHEFLILNTSKEELFGMVIIESMAQGVIPICRRQTGPQEIINPETGFIFEENQLETAISNILNSGIDLEEMRRNAMAESKKYRIENISKLWSPILD